MLPNAQLIRQELTTNNTYITTYIQLTRYLVRVVQVVSISWLLTSYAMQHILLNALYQSTTRRERVTGVHAHAQAKSVCVHRGKLTCRSRPVTMIITWSHVLPVSEMSTHPTRRHCRTPPSPLMSRFTDMANVSAIGL